jgi:hypothetical protein
MIDQRFMNQLADDMREPEEPVQEVMLASGPVTSDMPQTGVRVGRAGITPAQSAKAGGLDRPLVALLDTLAGALQGATAQTLGLPGDIRSIIDMIAQEGATKYLGERTMPTTTEMQQKLPAVIPQGVANQTEREYTAKVASDIGTFLPAPGLLDAPKAIKGAVQATKNMPVGMSTQMVGEGVSDLGFYSAAKQAVDYIQQPKGTGEQFLKQIEKTPGVKPEEIKWTGLDDFLKSKKTVTKAEVQEYLDKNRVEVREVQLGAVDEAELQAFLDDEAGQGFTRQEAIDYLGQGEGSTKFSKYTLPGGENYREILLTLPSKNPEFDPKDLGRLTELSNKTRSAAEDVEYKALAQRYDASLRGETNPEFKSQHFDQPNILAHMRVNDRVDADGKKVLFVEEVQSDWHQAGRKKGYQQPPNEARVVEINQRLRELAKSDMENTPEWETLTREKQSLQDRTGVPDAPFKTTWHELALKRAIQVAAEGGYDRIAFTTGKTQAERYDLSKQISRVTYTEAGVLRAYDKSGEMVLSKKLDSPDQIEDYIGKEPAKKLLEKEVGKIEVVPKNVFDGRELSGVDLQVGGEGMKGFYDQILPKFLDKYAKKWDAKVGMTDIITQKASDNYPPNIRRLEGGPVKKGIDKFESVQYIDITPKMKESVLTKGQPLFAIGAGGAAVQQEENQ